MSLGFDVHAEKICEISGAASKELSIEQVPSLPRVFFISSMHKRHQEHNHTLHQNPALPYTEVNNTMKKMHTITESEYIKSPKEKQQHL